MLNIQKMYCLFSEKYKCLRDLDFEKDFSCLKVRTSEEAEKSSEKCGLDMILLLLFQSIFLYSRNELYSKSILADTEYVA